MRYFSFRFNCLTWNLAKCNWCREWGDLSVSLTVVCSPSAWRVPCPFSKRYSGCIGQEANTLWIFLKESEMLVMFSGICYRTQENKIKRKLQCKVQKLTNWVLFCNTPVLIEMRPDSNWPHFNIDGETLVCVHLKSQRGRLRIGTSFGETEFESCPQNEAIIKR